MKFKFFEQKTFLCVASQKELTSKILQKLKCDKILVHEGANLDIRNENRFLCDHIDVIS